MKGLIDNNEKHFEKNDESLESRIKSLLFLSNVLIHVLFITKQTRDYKENLRF